MASCRFLQVGKLPENHLQFTYTREAPAHWTGVSRNTIFKARPDERVKGVLLMPIETAKRKLMLA